jgi:hypothetical protein
MSHRSQLHLFWTIDTVLSTRSGVSITQESQSIWTLCFSNTLLISSTASVEDSDFMAFYIVGTGKW